MDSLCGFPVGSGHPFFLIAGPCAIEDRDHALRTAEWLKGICDRQGVPLIYKSSFDKANRSSGGSYRGPGMEEGLAILGSVREEIGVPVLTDVHTPDQAAPVAEAVDVLQTPAFLCRQTDFIQAVAATGRPVNIKKGQFLAPWDMANVVAKAQEVGNDGVMACERGVSFGYNNLVADMRALPVMRETAGVPVVFDATHSVQLPGGAGGASGGQREHVPTLASAATGAGVEGLFMETHEDPDRAPSDGPNMWPLERMEPLLARLRAIHDAAWHNEHTNEG